MAMIWRLFLIHPCLYVLFACGLAPTREKENIRLIPLSPYSHEFTHQGKKCRIDYFFTAAGYREQKDFRESFYQAIKTVKSEDSSEYDLYSLYVYEETDKINENFAGDMNDLRDGGYDNYLMSYTRWNKDELDISYIIESGRVVFDMTKNEPVSPTWEFD